MSTLRRLALCRSSNLRWYHGRDQRFWKIYGHLGLPHSNELHDFRAIHEGDSGWRSENRSKHHRRDTETLNSAIPAERSRLGEGQIRGKNTRLIGRKRLGLSATCLLAAAYQA